MPTYLVRFAQVHESFRQIELQALADIAGIRVEFLKYAEVVSYLSLHFTRQPVLT
jgi:tRNA (guanine10-N2)-methyltransferase